ncbi:hypothetical protein PVAP13_2KG259258 [Panicum virgatum]|uniref:Aminotransferase-like plant mobile domain-containing protein n=1 Tax=Panicum virgatum TaxID=38727 RepID=A0A8T0VZ12_PANVG|nr:hypothetical protein PVAP13_2KG259258 [Panicum virgatum]
MVRRQRLPNFTTKLSLPKFIAVSKSLNANQRDLVKTMGFHHLLDLCCSYIPKNLILWLVSHFDVTTRSFNLPNGYSFTLSAHLVHQVLGIPIGSSPLSTVNDESAKSMICLETNCNGKYPTINELKTLIDGNLGGDKFKRIFALFTITSFLCPTSSECASPDFFTAICNTDNIISYNWSTIVLEKLVVSISKFQQAISSCSTASLGGCIFALMIIYFELLDLSELDLPDSIPRIRFWSNENVATYVYLDTINEEKLIFGKTSASIF